MKTINMFFLICLSFILISCNSYEGRYEVAGWGGVGVLYLNSDGTCTNGLGSENGGKNGTWKKIKGGIQIDEMSGYNGFWKAWDTENGKGFTDPSGLNWQKRDYSLNRSRP